MGSLRATGYPGHIILGISEDAPSDVVDYLTSQGATVHRYVKVDRNEGRPIDMNNPTNGHGWQWPREYHDY